MSQIIGNKEQDFYVAYLVVVVIFYHMEVCAYPHSGYGVWCFCVASMFFMLYDVPKIYNTDIWSKLHLIYSHNTFSFLFLLLYEDL